MRFGESSQFLVLQLAVASSSLSFPSPGLLGLSAEAPDEVLGERVAEENPEGLEPVFATPTPTQRYPPLSPLPEGPPNGKSPVVPTSAPTLGQSSRVPTCAKALPRKDVNVPIKTEKPEKRPRNDEDDEFLTESTPPPALSDSAVYNRMWRIFQRKKDGSFSLDAKWCEAWADLRGGGRDSLKAMFEKAGYDPDRMEQNITILDCDFLRSQKFRPMVKVKASSPIIWPFLGS